MYGKFNLSQNLMKCTNAVLCENVREGMFLTMVSIKFGLWDVTLCSLVDGCQCGMLKEHAACIRQGGINTRAAHEPLGALQT
jgi:hypothetical protein